MPNPETAQTMPVQDFLARLTHIRRANGKAPHKPVLLLALADWFYNGLALELGNLAEAELPAHQTSEILNPLP